MAAVCAAALLGGCAGGKSPEAAASRSTTTEAPVETTTTLAPTKEEYITAAGAICRDIVAESAAVPEPQRPAEYATAMRRTIELFRAGQARLRAVPKPPADAAALDAEFLARNDRQIEVLEQAMPALESAAATGDSAKIEAAFSPALESYAALAAEQERFLRSYGLVACIEEDD